MLLDSTIHLLERVPSDADITPAAVAYYGPDVTTPVDGHCGGEPGLCQLRPVPRMPA